MRHLIFSLLLINIAQAEDWPNWRGPRHDGISREALPKADFSKIAWRAKIGVGFSSMAVADGRVFALGSTGKRRGRRVPRALGRGRGSSSLDDHERCS